LLRLPPPPRYPLFPYTTLFRSPDACGPARRRGGGGEVDLGRGFDVLLPLGAAHVVGDAVELGERGDERVVEFEFAVVALGVRRRSEEHTSELQSLVYLVCRLLL